MLTLNMWQAASLRVILHNLESTLTLDPKPFSS
jgi:hypothetical protein